LLLKDQKAKPAGNSIVLRDRDRRKTTVKQTGTIYQQNDRLSVDRIFTCRLKQPCIYFSSATFAANKPHKFPKCLASKDSHRNYTVSVKNRSITSKQSLLKISV